MKPPAEPGGPELAYRDPDDDRPASATSQMMAWAVLTATIWVGAVAGLFLLAFTTDYRGENAPSGTAGTAIAFAGWAAMLAAMVFLTLRWRRAPARRDLVPEIRAGFGIACLIGGVCFAALS